MTVRLSNRIPHYLLGAYLAAAALTTLVAIRDRFSDLDVTKKTRLRNASIAAQ
jgi:hypothetical protein